MEPAPSPMDWLERWIRRTGLQDLATFLLEAFAPLAPLGSQVTYLLEPLVGGKGWAADLEQFLADPDERERFARRLSEPTHRAATGGAESTQETE